eukprot:gnl/TRDRNA2_/TRDRNA2_168746_c0_seq4.p1 gnl/TRDRNA2_/TRDRNA2_168746_c0~~gnl/TRDRNA2_/TRDRNA2_168746_c0_seq4.p1  ORF type:complete len:225 (+),score=24.49 gnl/TRDRNA2_/TRDRNA2_168746_c0_seq4:371-1045(+)
MIVDCLFFQRCKSTVKERLDVYRKYVLPYVKPNVSDACASEGDDMLTIHLRNGDTSRSTRSCHAQAPCEYLDKVINTGNNGSSFHSIRLISSNQLPQNPCLRHVKSEHADKHVVASRGTKAHDYCALIKAKNLALSVSSFSTTAKMLNTGLSRLFYFDSISYDANICRGKKNLNRHMMGYDFDSLEVCAAFPMAIRLQPNYTELRNCSYMNRASEDHGAEGARR